MQQKLTSSQETILQAFVDQQIENRHIFSHQKDVRMIPSPKGNLQWEMDYPKVFADLFEAILGAVYKDSGKDLENTRKVVLDAMEETISNFLQNTPICPLKRVTDINPQAVFR
ncbi:endoribonuclease dcr-1-like [Daphnia pulicaria]|uniref:endoribonuclease dcr-1-like n=1 Tax=Daphnia pulicaria TaxID=35523 RepID=UPI001EEB33B3|nr:endoribonuclease dcr-1-like [Daphnia pulicaria]